jgi:hypothetical protein
VEKNKRECHEMWVSEQVHENVMVNCKVTTKDEMWVCAFTDMNDFTETQKRKP